MRRKEKLLELLAPAGNIDCLYAAVAAGADAVYVGGARFGARAYAKNFELDELERAVRYCHLRNVKLYVTLNTLIEDIEMRDALEYAVALYRIGVDALIIADLGVISEVHRLIPDFELHASTQMSVHNTDGARVAHSLGCSRVVPARELSQRDIATLVDNSPTEIEVFLHGALCVCHSGQCLFSSLVGGRSGNRGECAQPCRLPYGDGYPLSLKDLSLADHIPELISSGVASLKIEGRMKSPSYVYTVTSIYRRLLDESRSANTEESDALRRAFSRNGFTDGYYVGRTDIGMTGIRSEDDKRDSRESDTFSPELIRSRVTARAYIRLGEPTSFTLTLGERSVTVYGDIPVAAESSPLTEDSVRTRLSKMGNTMLSLAPQDIVLTLDDNVNLSPASLNALRRSAAEAIEYSGREYRDLTEEIATLGSSRSYPKTVKDTSVSYSAEFMSESAYVAARDSSPELISGIKLAFVPLTSSDAVIGETSAVALPSVVFDSEMPRLDSELARARSLGAEYALINNIGELPVALRHGFKIICGFRLNVASTYSYTAVLRLGAEDAILSPELTLPKARDIGGRVITLGRIPLMVTERCFIKDTFGCDRCGNAALVDRKGERFPMMRERDHRNLILNSAVTYMGDRRDELSRYRISKEHFIFTVENGEAISDMLSCTLSGGELPSRYGAPRRIGRRRTEPESVTRKKVFESPREKSAEAQTGATVRRQGSQKKRYDTRFDGKKTQKQNGNKNKKYKK